MTTRSFVANFSESVGGGWTSDPDASGFYYILGSSTGDVLIMSTTHGVQFIPNSATINSAVATSWLVGADFAGGTPRTLNHAFYGSDLITISNTPTAVINCTPPAYNDAHPYSTNPGTCTPAATSKFSVVYITAAAGAFPEHWRLKVGSGFVAGDPPTVLVTFTLAAPVAVTNAATSTTTSSVTLNGTLNPSGANAYYPVSCYFEYGPTTAYGNVTPTFINQTGSSTYAVFANLTGLTANTTYHYRIVAANADNAVQGVDQSFVTTAGQAVLMVF